MQSQTNISLERTKHNLLISRRGNNGTLSRRWCNSSPFRKHLLSPGQGNRKRGRNRAHFFLQLLLFHYLYFVIMIFRLSDIWILLKASSHFYPFGREQCKTLGTCSEEYVNGAPLVKALLTNLLSFREGALSEFGPPQQSVLQDPLYCSITRFYTQSQLSQIN